MNSDLRENSYASRRASFLVCWLRNIRCHCGLLKEFVKRDIHGRFVGSAGGLLWTILTPLSQVIIFSFLFNTVFKIRLSRLEVGTESFIIFFLAGLFPWMAFSESLTRSTGILLEHANLITKVVFPTELLPTGIVCYRAFSSGAIASGFGVGHSFGCLGLDCGIVPAGLQFFPSTQARLC